MNDDREAPRGQSTNDNISNDLAGPRERVLQAALELFVEQGYFNTNVPDISKRSRCSVGSIYHHFLNKEDIATQIYRDGMGHFRKALADALNVDDSLELSIQNLVVAFLTFAQTNYLLSRYLWLARHSEFLSGRILQPTVVGFDELGRKLTKVIKKGIRLGEIPRLPAHIIWTIVFGIPVSYIRDWLDGYATEQPSDVANTLSRASWAALHGAA